MKWEIAFVFWMKLTVTTYKKVNPLIKCEKKKKKIMYTTPFYCSKTTQIQKQIWFEIKTKKKHNKTNCAFLFQRLVVLNLPLEAMHVFSLVQSGTCIVPNAAANLKYNFCLTPFILCFVGKILAAHFVRKHAAKWSMCTHTHMYTSIYSKWTLGGGCNGSRVKCHFMLANVIENPHW